MSFRSPLASSYFARYLLLNAPNLTDYRHFPSRVIQNEPPIFDFSISADHLRSSAFGSTIVYSVNGQRREEALDHFLQRTGTVAFLIIQNDTILAERYFAGYHRQSIVSSFSICKSFVSALIGIALSEKHLYSLDDPVTRYLPELRAPHWSSITLRHLVSMSSGLCYQRGLSFRGAMSPGSTTRTTSENWLPKHSPVKRRPSGFIIITTISFSWGWSSNERLAVMWPTTYKRRSGSRSVWKLQPTWSLDSERSGMEKMESGLNARAVDFAKFGRLYLRLGEWNGKQVVPEAWVQESTSVSCDAKWRHYKYLWWIPGQDGGRFMAAGNLGQFIYLVPDKELLIIRFGVRGGMKGWRFVFPQVFRYLEEAF